MTATPGLVVAPHARASEAGAAVLREGGTAVEALVAASSVCAVVWPHMTGLGGDGVWLLAAPGDSAPVVVESIGRAGEQAGVVAEGLCAEGLGKLPSRGPHAALTVPGAVAGWAGRSRTRERDACLAPVCWPMPSPWRAMGSRSRRTWRKPLNASLQRPVPGRALPL